jgi:hypothetical protein
MSEIHSTFFHIGVNRKNSHHYGVDPPHVSENGSIDFVPLPDHKDPDLDRLTYGDPWGRLKGFNPGDVAWFIETGTISKHEGGYYLMAYFAIDDVYNKRDGVWDKHLQDEHGGRIAHNAHELRGDLDYSIILGDLSKSRLLLQKPLRLTKGQDAYSQYKTILDLPVAKPTTGYWFKRWFGEKSTKALLRVISDDS